MINNRQNGRRRGRGGGPRSPGNVPSPGNNRQDNRSRGNAVQLHEKYKALARDSQLAGDRIQTEYYLQFAEHYFRVLNENRVRFEEQRRQRDDYSSSDEEEYRDEGVTASDENERDERSFEDRPMRESSGRESSGRESSGRETSFERDQHSGDGRGRHPRSRAGRDDARGEGEHYGRSSDDNEIVSEERISLDSLPPAISVVDNGEDTHAPRRRTRRPRGDAGEADIAPAA